MMGSSVAIPTRSTVAAISSKEEVPDATLLSRFTERQDQAAFNALVLRYGPMVFRICHRILGDMQHAEDAVQAVFVVLLRKADSIGRPDLIGNWLYGVAVRVARKARSKTNRERAGELHADVAGADERSTDADRIEVRAILDEELRQLPEKYRAPLVLCYLGGKSNLEAARLLDCPAGSISARLMRGRRELGRRLRKRGVLLSIGMLTLYLKQASASASVPAESVDSAVDRKTCPGHGPCETPAVAAPDVACTKQTSLGGRRKRVWSAFAVLLLLLLAVLPALHGILRGEGWQNWRRHWIACQLGLPHLGIGGGVNVAASPYFSGLYTVGRMVGISDAQDAEVLKLAARIDHRDAELEDVCKRCIGTTCTADLESRIGKNLPELLSLLNGTAAK